MLNLKKVSIVVYCIISEFVNSKKSVSNTKKKIRKYQFVDKKYMTNVSNRINWFYKYTMLNCNIDLILDTSAMDRIINQIQ